METVDYRSPPDQQQEELPKKENVSVVHLTRNPPHSGGGVLAGAAEAVGNTFQSVKDAIFGGGKDKSHK